MRKYKRKPRGSRLIINDSHGFAFYRIGKGARGKSLFYRKRGFPPQNSLRRLLLIISAALKRIAFFKLFARGRCCPIFIIYIGQFPAGDIFVSMTGQPSSSDPAQLSRLRHSSLLILSL